MLGTMPISALMEEKIKDPFVKTGLITMSGNVKVNIKENDAYISDPCSNFKNGKITVVVNPDLVVRLRTSQLV